ncbi:uncharacterized protein K452DRAFT_321764 [Aplosporella prunicola CBS 121167]|uniref:Uncharacterized protein n=1 Tax=Aplosporella prunicola CBS 121167 TaxID=1176127 RepID=A0A6A6B462_9PEZI|nr:uncharacterized protein K452DRAFT_321764 [Aplosporella prunicola CBS 121167]KAF2137531.1 hypothetical protein K452DRAFT_321764 [Aplosporella prunicola CBS 121167]
MYNFGGKDATPAPKCYFTHATLPDHIDPQQPPTKKKPFSLISSQPFSHTADLILPEEVYEAVKQELGGNAGTFHYAKVTMSLGEIISGDFFNQYIKTGNIMMISEGRPGIDNTYTLHEGILRLDLDKATYERCGLVGKPAPHGGRKHTKARYVVETNLREPSMLHGKKGFARLEWAFRNVLTQSLAWLFHDLTTPFAEQTPGPPSQTPPPPPTGPIAAHKPTLHALPATPTPHPLPATKTPPLHAPTLPTHLQDTEYSAAVLEWLGMASLSSPRLAAADGLDRYLCRWDVPVPYRAGGNDGSGGDGGEAVVRDLVRLRWRGLLPPRLLLHVWLLVQTKGLACEEGKGKEGAWAALSVAGFRGEAYAVLGTGGRDVFVWESA